MFENKLSVKNVPRLVKAKLIGKGGCHFYYISANTGCYLWHDKYTDTILIRGHHPFQVKQAWNEICSRLDKLVSFDMMDTKLKMMECDNYIEKQAEIEKAQIEFELELLRMGIVA